MRLKNYSISGVVLFLFSILTTDFVNGQNPLFKVESNYLSRHDIVYQTPAYEGFEGFPVGNGDMGGMVWNTNNGVEVQINKNDLFDQSHEENRSTLRGGVRLNIDFGAPGFDWIYLDDFEGRLSLQNAEVTLKAKTPFMENSVISWVVPDKNVWCFQIKASSFNQLKEGTKIRVSLERWGSRAFPGWYGYFSKDTKSGLGNTNSLIIGKDLVLEEAFQELHFSVVCRILGEETSAEIISSNRLELETKGIKPDHDLTVIVSMVTSNESENPTQSAVQLLNDFEKQTLLKEKEAHQKWWKNYWSQSFVHLENDYIENIYYLRRYLMASSSRGKFPVVFNGGLWNWNHDVRNWVTQHHWNTQQQYWGLCAQNDCDLMLPYLNTYFSLISKAEEHAKKRGAENAILWAEPHDFFGSMTFWERGDMLNNFTPASQIAGLFWEYFQYTSDTVFLAEKAYPFMKKAAEFYVQKLQWDSLKNEYFIFPSQPYENPRSNNLRNPVTDRNVIISNFANCINAARILNLDKAKIKEWQHILGNLWPIPYQTVPEAGEVIAHAWYPDGTIFPKIEERGKWLSHMSASTSAVFPANLVGIDLTNTREYNAMVNMIRHRSPTVNAISPEPIVAARLGMGNEVLTMMQNGIRRLQHFPQGLFYNIDHWYNLSLYMDSLKTPDISAQRDYIYDERSHYPNKLPAKPFIQCGLEPQSIYGAAINEMLLQSNEGKIRVFPAVPDNWASTFTLLARGAFVVSSEIRKDGTIPGVYIESRKGNVCRIVNPWSGSEVTVVSRNEPDRKIRYETDEKNGFEFKTLPGHSYLIVPKGKEEMLKQTVYESNPNQSPKKFYGAALGKGRNF
jgi:alpha-L-fucosidase 2